MDNPEKIEHQGLKINNSKDSITRDVKIQWLLRQKTGRRPTVRIRSANEARAELDPATAEIEKRGVRKRATGIGRVFVTQ